jgi:HAD superfamily hydrolase (TIGR01509 family)
LYDLPVSDLFQFRPRAVIFDLDGTLADNMHWHAQAFDAFVRRHQLPPVTMDVRRRIDGKRNSEILPMLFGREISREELHAYETEKEGTYRALSRGVLQPVRGARRLLERLAAHGIAVAVATSSPADNVAHTLGELGLADAFAVIARSDQVPRGKPAPDVYLAAARLLGAPPDTCLAFEDAPIGVIAARTAGMRCVAITSTFTAAALAEAVPPPDAAYADFASYLDDAGRWLAQPPGERAQAPGAADDAAATRPPRSR